MMNDVGPILILLAIALALFSGVPGLFLGKESRAGERGASLLMAMAAASAFAAVGTLLFSDDEGHTLRRAWGVPGGEIAVELDGISAVFLIQVFLISLLGSVYGLEYWSQKDHPKNGGKLRFFYGAMTAGMAALIVAKNAIFFLFGWEIMAIAAFFTLTTEDRDEAVRESGLVYIIATRLGTLALIAMFIVLYEANGGSFEITWSAEAAARSPRAATAIFVLGLVGFGLKAGVMPLHVWLPGAHANAPSHVSALMSGVLIKTGVYGLVRMLSLFEQPPLWWGLTLLALGLTSGVLGVVFAIGQHDFKRLLAYHSVENIGIIVMGLGLAVLGRSLGRPDLVALGLAGCVLHVVNHGLFKALLFLAAGAVLHATGTREIDHLGGLLKKMPLTAAAFLVGAVAICGLPPLNGFISELFIYVGVLRGLAEPGGGAALAAASLVAPGLALIGALAVACFVKVFGAIFLGEPRTRLEHEPHEPGPLMLVPMGVLAALCAAIGLGPLVAVPLLERAIFSFAPDRASVALIDLAPLFWVSAGGVALVALAGMLWWLLARTLSRRPVGSGPTWDCGYAAPSVRMQYSSSSFAQMLVELFSWALRPKVHRRPIKELFPRSESFSSHVPDVVLDGLVYPAIGRGVRLLSWFRWVQLGSIHAYLFYILLAIVVLHFLV